LHNGLKDTIPTCEELHKNEVGIVPGQELDEWGVESTGGGGWVRDSDVPKTEQTPNCKLVRVGQQCEEEHF